MKLSSLVGLRLREAPAGTEAESHSIMLRGGYMKQVAAGIYSQYLPLRLVCRNIEGIIRREMDALGGQEVLLPVVMPDSLWSRSGRLDSVGPELVRLRDRGGAGLVLGMTHEEAAVHLAQNAAQSHSQFPFMIYQIQTKFRDEARPRAGLIRVREFTMKDAYSFHTGQQCLEDFYTACLDAYMRIFAAVGIPQTVAVASDSGMMGGSVSHEFMLLHPRGEDTVALCRGCGHAYNTAAQQPHSECKEREGRETKRAEPAAQQPRSEASCPKCGGQVELFRGIEVGNIFQLGDKYTRAMGMTYTGSDGVRRHPVMGCYGIGVGRLAASVCQSRHDGKGPLWPKAIAPWQVHICCLRADIEAARQAADSIYRDLLSQGVAAIYDDRRVRAGEMLADADLLGTPVRIIIGPAGLESGEAEVASRDGKLAVKPTLQMACAAAIKMLAEVD